MFISLARTIVGAGLREYEWPDQAPVPESASFASISESDLRRIDGSSMIATSARWKAREVIAALPTQPRRRAGQ